MIQQRLAARTERQRLRKFGRQFAKRFIVAIAQHPQQFVLMQTTGLWPDTNALGSRANMSPGSS